MKKHQSKIIALAVVGFGGLSLLLPGLASASGGWTDLSWNRPRTEARGMWYLENWLDGVQQRWNKSDHNHHHDDNSGHRQSVSVNYGGNNNVNVRQHQEVTGDFKRVEMEQTVRVYVNGTLTASDQQLSVHGNGDKAEQWQEVSLHH